MLCNSCKNRFFCKYADFFFKIEGISLEIKSCMYKNNSEDVPPENNNNIEMIQQRIERKKNLIEKMKKENKVEDVIVKCPTCEGKTYSKDIKKCDICGKDVCPACSTNYNKKILCDECWREE